MSSLPIFLRPSTKTLEIDLTQRSSVILSTTGCVVGEFERGSLYPTYQSGIEEDFRKLYGQIADPTIGFAHDTAITFMTQSGNLLVNRVVGSGAKYAGITVVKDTANKRVMLLPFGAGSDLDYKEIGSSKTILLQVDSDLVANDTFKMNVTDGDTVVGTTPVTFATSHNNTMTQIAASIQVALNTFSIGSTAVVYNELNGSNNKTIVIRPANNVSLDFDGIVASGFNATLVEDAKLCDILAENPGDWANDYGIRLSEINTGIRERFNMTFAGAIVTGSTITVTVNGTTVTQAFTTDNDTTLANLAASLEALPSINEATVQEAPGAVDNDRTILIVAQKPGLDQLSITATVTGGSANPIAVVTRLMTGVAADNSFTLEVFSRSNTNNAVETFVVSLPKQLNARGFQQNIKQVVNESSNKSYNIRVVQDTNANTNIYDTDGTPYAIPSTITFMTGGANGTKATSADIRRGWRAVDDRVQWPFSVMLNAGYTSITVQKEMAAIAEERSDCIAILDAPSDKQDAQVLRDYRLNELDIDTSYAALYTPDVEYEDIMTGERRYIPPSGPVGATYAYSDRLSSFVGAPAGLNRGKVTLATGLRFKYSPAQQELIYPEGINYIMDKPGVGPVVMAEETLQRKKSVLSSVHARRILNYVKTSLVDGLDYVHFEPNTDYTRFQVRQLIDTVCLPLTSDDGNGGLYAYKGKCDKDNNPPQVIDADQLAVDVYLQIVRVIKGILLRSILTRTGAKFEEIVLQ